MLITRIRKTVFVLATLVVTFGTATVAYAHGVVINYTLETNGKIDLHAEFDTGEAMGEAQVTVYSPADPLTPWLTGTADAEGNYTFVLDPEIPGSWDIQFRKAGHGDIIHLQLDEGMIDPALMTNPPGELMAESLETAAEKVEVPQEEPNATSKKTTVLSSGGNTGNSGGFTSLQILLMSGSVIWGFVGTALYFSNRKTQGHNHDHGHHH